MTWEAINNLFVVIEVEILRLSPIKLIIQQNNVLHKNKPNTNSSILLRGFKKLYLLHINNNNKNPCMIKNI
jgi:hypothetical protein